MKILVTGGAGFIGSNFIKYILNKYKTYKVTNLDLLTYAGNLENLSDIQNNPNYEFIKGDICNKELALELTKNCDAVVNFAAESHVDRSILTPSIFAKTNIEGTVNLLNAAKANKIQRFVQISTDEVYGSTEFGFFKETTPINPTSPYSASKASADLFALSYFKTFKLPCLITRCSNNFGPCQYPEKLIPFFISRLLRGEKLPLYGDGKNVRDWIYVLDHCKGIDLVLHKGREGEIYNIGAKSEKTNIEIAELILDKMGKSLDMIEYVTDRPAHDRRYAISNDKIQTELGFQPEHPFEHRIEQTIDWYLNNKTWLKNIETKIGGER